MTTKTKKKIKKGKNGVVFDLSKLKEGAIERSHPLIEDTIIDMIAGNSLCFYGEFALNYAFIESKEKSTMGVIFDLRGPKLFWYKLNK